MAKDFAKKKPRTGNKTSAKKPSKKTVKAKTKTKRGAQRKAEPQPASLKRWLLTIVVVGGFLYMLGQLLNNGRPSQESVVAKPQAAVKVPSVNKSATDKAVAEKKTAQDDFEFYQILHDSKVDVDVKPLDALPQIQYQYFIQAGSFKRQTDADSHRASLLLQGLSAHVEGPKEGATGWYRVMVGPFSKNAGGLSKVRSNLVDQGYDTLLVKRNPD